MNESLIEGEGKIWSKLRSTMPPNLELSSQYAKVTIGLKRKIEDEQPGAAKKRAEQLDELPSCFSKSEYPIEFSPPREEDTTVPPGLSEDVPPATPTSCSPVPATASPQAPATTAHSSPTVPPSLTAQQQQPTAPFLPQMDESVFHTTTEESIALPPLQQQTCHLQVESSQQICPLRGETAQATCSGSQAAAVQQVHQYPGSPGSPGHLQQEEEAGGGVQQVPENNKRCADDEAEQRLKRHCTEADAAAASVPRDSRPPSSLEEPLIMPPESSEEENKENLVCLKTLTESQNFESILQKTLLATRTDGGGQTGGGGVNSIVTGRCKGTADNNGLPIVAATMMATSNAKVIVEHLPSSVYEHLDHSTTASTLVDDESTSLDDDDVIDDDSDDESSMFDTPPPKTAYDRFWSTTTTLSNSTTTVQQHQQQQQATTTTSSQQQPLVSTYQFLEQNNQRIECDENGKSYLQLGTVNHHHLPVTPVLQPKPTTLTPRRGPAGATISGVGGGGPCRPSALPPRPPNPTPPVLVCEHPPQSSVGGLLTARSCSSSCYRQQRSDMLSLSLHKLHTARQRSDSSLRRSVLICNMLRYIELESTTEQRQQAEAIGYGVQEPTIVGGLVDQSPYWNTGPVPNFSPPPTPNPYRDNNGGAGGNGGSAGGYTNGGMSGGIAANSVGSGGSQPSCENSFDAPLKDFNSAFRQSSAVSLVSSPGSPQSSSSCSGGGSGAADMSPSSLTVVSATSPSHHHHHHPHHHHVASPSSSGGSSPTGSSSSSLDDERGINWSSVLSLTSQTELDPLNNNSCYSDSVGVGGVGCWTTSGAASLSEQLDHLSQTSFEDVSSWKVSASLPASAADDLMKSFPEENLFECAA